MRNAPPSMVCVLHGRPHWNGPFFKFLLQTTQDKLVNADEKNLSVNAFPKEVSPDLNFFSFSFFLFLILWQ